MSTSMQLHSTHLLLIRYLSVLVCAVGYKGNLQKASQGLVTFGLTYFLILAGFFFFFLRMGEGARGADNVMKWSLNKYTTR